MKKSTAFTLIELLIVVAIIAILAAIAVPNFLEARTRAKVSRVQNDLRTLNVGVEAYYIDHGGYPPIGTYSPRRPGTSNQMDQKLVTTPIAYLNEVPTEVFPAKWDTQRIQSYRLYSCHMPDWNDSLFPANSWMGFSMGPDLTTSTGGFYSEDYVIINEGRGLNGYYGGYNYGGTWEYFNQAGFRGLRYDPTNGTVSLGDIYRFGANARRQPL